MSELTSNVKDVWSSSETQGQLAGAGQSKPGKKVVASIFAVFTLSYPK